MQLGEKCDSESLNKQIMKGGFQFRLPIYKPNEVRVVFVGDSTTQGWGGTSMADLFKESFITRNIESFDGRMMGNHGWPYVTAEHLKHNNPTNDYTFMNLAIEGSTILKPGVFHNYRTWYNGCRIE